MGGVGAARRFWGPTGGRGAAVRGRGGEISGTDTAETVGDNARVFSRN